MSTATVKEQVKELLEQLPEDASWDDVLDKVRVRRLIEKGLKDARAGRVQELSAVRQQFGLEPL